MKVLNLYAGIGGNRKLWEDVEVTAVENNKEIAKIYQDFFPNDKVIVADAHKYLLEHYKEFDFIWSSPPCPTHSRINFLNNEKIEQGIKPQYPCMKLYEEIIFLKTWFKRKWVVENVISYYEPLIKPFICASHYFWANFHIDNKNSIIRGIRENINYVKEKVGFNLNGYTGINKRKTLNNCVEPKTALFIFNCAFKVKQKEIMHY
jgi:DNA (cytosine-5)-methyltransferase 1